MAGLKPELSNSDNWNKLYEVTKTATVVNSIPPSHNPIPPFFVPFQFESPTIAIFTTTQNPKMTWKSGGYAAANVVTGIMRGGDASSEIARQFLTLGDVTICRFPGVAGTYSLKLYPPYWFKDYFVEVFEYIGPGLAEPESKLDAIYNLLNP